MDEIDEFELRKGDKITLKILKHIAENPSVPRTELRDIAPGPPTIKKVLIFLEKIGAITIEKEESGTLEIWRSTTTPLGIRILRNANIKLKRYPVKRKEYAPLADDDRKSLKEFILHAHNLGFLNKERAEEFVKLTKIWGSADAKGEKTNVLAALKKIRDCIAPLGDVESYRDSNEFLEYRVKMDLTIEELEDELIS